MRQQEAPIAARASLLGGCVLALVAVGYALCLGMVAVCPALVPTPEWWIAIDAPDDVFRLSTVSLLYWMLALAVAIALGALITLLAGRALRALAELAPSRRE